LGWEVLVKAPQAFVQQTLVLPCRDPETAIRLDFIFSFSPYERQAVQRARRVTIGQAQIRFATVEDVIILKVVAGRPRDLDDVRGMLAKNPQAELHYVREWLAQFEAAISEPVLQRFDELVAQPRGNAQPAT
jgi:predicted nucleotidyltransferase